MLDLKQKGTEAEKILVLFIHSDVIYCKHISIITVVYFVIIIA